MTVATSEAVETSLMRPLTLTESQYVQDLLARAERMLLARIPNLIARSDSDEVFSHLVSDIEAEAVARVFRAPDNGIMRQEAEGNYSYSLNLHVASGLLDILDKDWAKLGVGSWGSLGPVTDGYLSSRFSGVGYPFQFQYGWPAHDEISEQW